MLALQVLYEVDVTGHAWEDSLRAHAEAVQATPAVAAFAEGHIAGVLGDKATIDVVIKRYARAWPLDQVSAVDRNILRLAFHELRKGSATPPKVAINEAVELAKEFGGEGSARFVNGVLGAALEEARSLKQPTA